MEMDFRKRASTAAFDDVQTIRAKVLDGGGLEAQGNRFLRELCTMYPGADIIGVTRCGEDAVLILYRVPANKAA